MVFDKPKIPKHLLLDQPPQRTSRMRSLTWLMLALLIFTVSVVFTTRASAENEGAHTGEFWLNDGESWMPALHVKSRAHIEINGMIATVEIVQEFSNTSDLWKEGKYLFPLPEGAAVFAMEMLLNERKVIGRVKEREAARAEYIAAKKMGKRAALLDQKRPNLFKQHIANIEPGGAIKVVLRYFETLRYDNKLFSLRLPTTFTPRYHPGAVPDNKTNLMSDGDDNYSPIANANLRNKDDALFQFAKTNTFADLRYPTTKLWHEHAKSNDALENDLFSPTILPKPNALLNAIEISVSLNSGVPIKNIYSPYHDIDIEKQSEQHYKIELSDFFVNMDRDFLLTWTLASSDKPQASIFRQTLGDEHYYLLMVVPPDTQDTTDIIARDIVFIIDTSGSMDGKSIRQAKNSLLYAISRLSTSTRFNIVEFNSQHTRFSKQLVRANPKNKKLAKNWIARLSAGGGTEMYPALAKAINSFDDEEKLKQLVFITDGAISNESELFHLIAYSLGNIRLFTVGIGSAPNTFFMNKAAEFGRGSFTYIGDQSEVKAKIRTLFKKLESTAISKVHMDWPDGVEMYPTNLPDVYHGEPLIVAARGAPFDGLVAVGGETAEGIWEAQVLVDDVVLDDMTDNKKDKGIAKVWARKKIESLADRKRRTQDKAPLRKQIIETSIKHQVMSQYTSFIAVEDTPYRSEPQVDDSEDIAKLLSHSMSPHSISPHPQSSRRVRLPQTATTAEVTGWFGLFAVLLIIFICRMRSDEE